MGATRGKGLLEGPVSARLCVALVLFAAALDAMRALPVPPQPLVLLQGIVTGSLAMTLAFAFVSQALPYARAWNARGARVSVTLSMVLSLMLAAASLWVGWA